MADDADVLYPRTLHSVVLPGTHDSGAYWLTKQTMPDAHFPPPWATAAIAVAEKLGIPVDEVITNWALTQGGDVSAQLHAGYRYLDIRAGWNGTKWCVHHAEVGVPVSFVLSQLRRFLEKHKGEFVVVQVSHLDGTPSEEVTRALKTTIAEVLRDVLLPRAVDVDGNCSLNRTIGEMVSMNHRALVVFGDGDYGEKDLSSKTKKVSKATRDIADDFLWPPRLLRNGWADTGDPSVLVGYARAQTIAFANGNASKDSGATLSKLSWTLTAQVGTVLESVLPGRPKTLRALNAKAEPLLFPFARESVQFGCRTSNILSVDFATGSDAVTAARLMNQIDVARKCVWEVELSDE
jgi:hypothetical protein